MKSHSERCNLVRVPATRSRSLRPVHCLHRDVPIHAFVGSSRHFFHNAPTLLAPLARSRVVAQRGGDGQICSGLGDPRHCRSLDWLVSARPSPYPRSNSSGSSFASLQLSLRESLRVLRPVETSWSHALVRVDEALSWSRVPCATFVRYVAMAITVFEPMCVSIWWSILCSGQRRHCDSFTTDSPLS